MFVVCALSKFSIYLHIQYSITKLQLVDKYNKPAVNVKNANSSKRMEIMTGIGRSTPVLLLNKCEFCVVIMK